MVRRFDAVIFDYGGVLSVSPFRRFQEAEHAMGLPPGTLADLFGYGLDVPEPPPGEPYSNKWHQLEVGAIELQEYSEWVADRAEALLGVRVDLASRVAGGVAGMSILWPMVHEVRRLRQDGYRTAICTNNIAAIRQSWQQQVPLGWFDVVVDSSVEGVRKPEPEIYRLTADRLGVDPARALFLDDHPGNVRGAQAVGMTALLVDDDDLPAALSALRAMTPSAG